MLQSVGSQRVRWDLANEQQQQFICFHCPVVNFLSKEVTGRNLLRPF